MMFPYAQYFSLIESAVTLNHRFQEDVATFEAYCSGAENQTHEYQIEKWLRHFSI